MLLLFVEKLKINTNNNEEETYYSVHCNIFVWSVFY